MTKLVRPTEKERVQLKGIEKETGIQVMNIPSSD